MYYLDQSRDLAIAQIPRCALTSIMEWLGAVPVVRNDDSRLQSITRRVAFVRDPVDRLESAFSLFYWVADYGRPHVSNTPIDSWESFIDHVLDPTKRDDEHYVPQSEHIGNVANIFHRLENLIDRFEIYRPGILPHLHKTSRSPLIPDDKTYRIDELRAKYAQDLIMYRDAD